MIPRIGKPKHKKISAEEKHDLRSYLTKFGHGVRQKTVRDRTTKENPGTLLVYVYEEEPESAIIDFFDENINSANSIVYAKSTIVLAKRGFCHPIHRISSVFLCELLSDIEEGSTNNVGGIWYAQSEIDPLEFTLLVEGVISLPSIVEYRSD